MTNARIPPLSLFGKYLMGRGVPGYIGYTGQRSVHAYPPLSRQAARVIARLLQACDLTPLKSAEIDLRADREVLNLLKKSLRMLCIDGPNCIIGFTPDGTCL